MALQHAAEQMFGGRPVMGFFHDCVVLLGFTLHPFASSYTLTQNNSENKSLGIILRNSGTKLHF